MIEVELVPGSGDLEACCAIRRVVFIDEQEVPEDEEWDGLDEACTHFLARLDGRALGTARLRIDPGYGAKAERVAVMLAARGTGVGRAVMLALEDEARAQGWPRVTLAAQLQALPFYERLGYVVYGPEFDDAGIPHRMAVKELPA